MAYAVSTDDASMASASSLVDASTANAMSTPGLGLQLVEEAMDATHAKLLVGAPTLSTHTAVALAADIVHATMAANPGTTVAPEPLAAVAMATSSEHSATTMASQALTLSPC